MAGIPNSLFLTVLRGISESPAIEKVLSDVKQHFKFYALGSYSKGQPSCLALYEKEKAEGTEPPTKDKMWNLYRVNAVSDDEKGALIGKYQRRGDATKAIRQIAYQPEPKW